MHEAAGRGRALTHLLDGVGRSRDPSARAPQPRRPGACPSRRREQYAGLPRDCRIPDRRGLAEGASCIAVSMTCRPSWRRDCVRRFADGPVAATGGRSGARRRTAQLHESRCAVAWNRGRGRDQLRRRRGVSGPGKAAAVQSEEYLRESTGASGRRNPTAARAPGGLLKCITPRRAAYRAPGMRAASAASASSSPAARVRARGPTSPRSPRGCSASLA